MQLLGIWKTWGNMQITMSCYLVLSNYKQKANLQSRRWCKGVI